MYTQQALVHNPQSSLIKCKQYRPKLLAQRPPVVRVCSFRGSSNAPDSVGTSDYISYILSHSNPFLDDQQLSTDEPSSDLVVSQVVDNVQQKLNHLGHLNATSSGNLHNLNQGLDTVIQTAHLAQSVQVLAAGDSLPSRPLSSGTITHSSLPGSTSASPSAQQEPDVETSLACVMQHPGALCCTKSTSTANPAKMTCTVTLETTARLSGGGSAASSISIEDLQTLAAQALVSSAAEQCRTRVQTSQEHTHPPQRMERHEDLVHVLSSGTVLAAERNSPSQFGHESYVLLLGDARSGRRVRAIFKPRVPGDADGWHRAPIEWVAYQLNLMLGMDYVPPVAYRHEGLELDLGGDEGWAHPAEGAMMYWVESASQLKHYSPEMWGVRQDLLLSDTRILDVLLHNSDRHHGHFLLGRHWCEGGWQGGAWSGELRPVLIDHAAGFRSEAHVTMEHENAFQTGAVRCVSARTYLRLRFLDAAIISAKFSDVLSEREMRDLLHRRNYILKYLDRLVEEQGYEATVIE